MRRFLLCLFDLIVSLQSLAVLVQAAFGGFNVTNPKNKPKEKGSKSTAKVN